MLFRSQSRRTSTGGGAEKWASALRLWDLREERAAVHEERKGTCFVEELGRMHICVLDQQVEDYDCVCRIVSEWSAGGSWSERVGAGRIGLGAATETDYRGMWGEGWEA